METADLLNQPVPSAHVQVVSIGELYLAAYFLQVLRGYGALDGAHRPHIHKYRRLYIPVNRVKHASFGAPFLFPQFIHYIFPFPDKDSVLRTTGPES